MHRVLTIKRDIKQRWDALIKVRDERKKKHPLDSNYEKLEYIKCIIGDRKEIIII